jgi:hypothetical protein
MRASAPTRAPAAPCQPRIASVRAPGRVQGPARLPRPRAVGEDWSKPSEKYAGFKYDFANSVRGVGVGGRGRCGRNRRRKRRAPTQTPPLP